MVVVTPSLSIDPSSPLSMLEALALIQRGKRASVSSDEEAVLVLTFLGVPLEAAKEKVNFGYGR
jgi:hypothetical protein